MSPSPASQGLTYKIWDWGALVGRSATAPVHVGVAGVAKCNPDTMPFVIPIELICASLARYIGLPVPPSFVVEREDVLYHVSLNFLLAGESLPPADAEAVVAHDHHLASGIVAFDIWISNGDRHNQNLAFDQTSKRIAIFDHSHALGAGGDVVAHFANCREQLGLGSHCLAPLLTAPDGLSHWAQRIVQVPGYAIHDAIAAGQAVGLPEDVAAPLATFLVERQGRIMHLCSQHPAVFPKVPAHQWALYREQAA